MRGKLYLPRPGLPLAETIFLLLYENGITQTYLLSLGTLHGV